MIVTSACGERLRAADHVAGTQVVCLACGKALTVPLRASPVGKTYQYDAHTGDIALRADEG